MARPIGGVVLAGYADRRGRKHALILMIMMMAVGTGLMGVLPTYAAIGVLAPILVLVARLIQGFSAGGEFGSASTLLIEFATPGRRGYYASWQMVSQALAFAFAATFAYGLSTRLSPASFESWGWRAPFLAGVLIGPIGRTCDANARSRRNSENISPITKAAATRRCATSSRSIRAN